MIALAVLPHAAHDDAAHVGIRGVERKALEADHNRRFGVVALPTRPISLICRAPGIGPNRSLTKMPPT